MTQENRVLNVWIHITSFGLPLLVMAAAVLGWSSVVQLVLGIVLCVAIVGTKIALTDWDEWRADRAERRLGREERRSQGSGANGRRTRT